MNSKHFIQLKNIQKTYDDGYTACKNINISIDKGKFVTILGPSGCGKTTLLKMIAGFETPTQGRIEVNGIDIKDLPIYARPTATVFQDYALFPNMTVYENISYGIKVMRVQLPSIKKSQYKKIAKIKKQAIEKATKKIEIIKLEQIKIDRDILRTKKEYEKDPNIAKIQDMRYSQFMSQINHYEKLMGRLDPNFDGFKLTLRLQRKIAKNKIKLSTLNKIEKQAYKLIRYYILKQPIDRKIDKLMVKYNNLDQWISYWENYPQSTIEQYEKIHTTRLLNKKEIATKAHEVINLVGLNGYENKYPSDLSGGMQQRVALARAIVVQPEILLLDEPLSALDAKVRKKMQEELKRIHNELKINFILVTHDQEEALKLSDQIIVMSKGKIEQIGTPKNIYEHPTNEWVANFIGQANFIDCTYVKNNTVLIYGQKMFIPNLSKEAKLKLSKNHYFKLLIRPEDIEICPVDKGYVNMKITQILYKGNYYEVKCVDRNKNELFFLTYKQQQINNKIGIKWNFKYTSIIYPKENYLL